MPISTGAALGAQAAGGIYSAYMNAQQNQQNIHFQREMATHAHQYEMADLALAGLNPILAAGGSGATASGGSSIPISNPFQDITNSAQKVDLMDKQLEKLDAEITNINASTGKMASDVTKSEYMNTLLEKYLGPLIDALGSPNTSKETNEEKLNRQNKVLKDKGLGLDLNDRLKNSTENLLDKVVDKIKKFSFESKKPYTKRKRRNR